MKAVISALAVVFACSFAYSAAAAEHETKKVCIDVKDKDGKVAKNKDGSNKQQCKDVKVHKKLEGTAVPEKK